MGNAITLLIGVIKKWRDIVQTTGFGPLIPDFVHIQPFGKTKAATTLNMDNYILEVGVQALSSIATILRAQVIVISPQPAETSQTEYSRWGSPAQTHQTTFAGRAVTRRDLDAKHVA